MSQENVDVVRSLMTAWEAGDYDTAMSFYSEHAMYEPGSPATGAAQFTGRASVEEGLADWFRTFDRYWTETLRLIDAGDHVVQLVREGGRGKVSGVPVEAQSALVYTFRSGEIVRVLGFSTHQAALEAVGPAE